MKTYADTSLLFSLYGTDSHSPKADAWRRSNPAPLPFTAFHRVELRNALSLAVFQQRLYEQTLFEKQLDRDLDILDGLVAAEVQTQTVEHFAGSQANEEQRTMEDTAGIPTGVAFDIHRQIETLRAKTISRRREIQGRSVCPAGSTSQNGRRRNAQGHHASSRPTSATGTRQHGEGRAGQSAMRNLLESPQLKH